MKNFKDNRSFSPRGASTYSASRDTRGGGYSSEKRSFNGGSRPRFGGESRPSYSGRDLRGFGGDRQSEMFKATCADCQTSCEVPFRPSGDRPVFCTDCFGGKKGAVEDMRDKFETKSSYRDTKPSAHGAPVDISIVLAKLDTLIAAVEKLTSATESAVVQEVVFDADDVSTDEDEKAPKAKKAVKKVATEKKPAKKAIAKK